MKAKLAKRPELIERLIPTFGVGCRRLTPGIGYLETLTQDNVNVVMDNILKFTGEGVMTIDGTKRKVDTIICATVWGLHSSMRCDIQLIFTSIGL